ncbi:hypothetical protein HXX76_011227 [Chlamydomonas incerta]|uniref:Uncharacterized protein n=1 Tax=Chlamydomonas incerta TaxID=51695 RepID=A0A835VX05_CHLIN|nr:hypothetical protein HXX76_011227 [Chlamydomonas incerta]|eukprot:KAG2428983.1 hypothetical protein HXX76_011227 [Chlamydomonas incerta]
MLEQAEGGAKVSAPANSRPPVAPKKTEPGAKTAKVSGSGGVRPPSAGLSAWEDAAGAHDCDLLAYLGKAEDAAAPGGVRAGSSPGNRALSQTGDGNLTQALLAARLAAEAERSAAQLEQRQELERRASQASRGGSSSVSGGSDRQGGSGKPPRAPEQKSAPAAGGAAGGGGGEAADPRLQGLLSDDEDNDDDLVDLMEADDDVLFAGCGSGGGGGDKERNRASSTGAGGTGGGGKGAAAAPAAPAAAAKASAEAEAEPDVSAAAAGRGAGGSGGGASSGSSVLAGGSRGSSAESGGAQAAPGRRKPQSQGSMKARGGVVAQAGHGSGGVAPQASQALLYGQQSQALLSYQQQYYGQLPQQQPYTLHAGQAAPTIPVVQVGEGLRQLQMQPRRAFTPGQANRSPVRGSGYVVATAANARVLTPPGSPTSRSGQSGTPPVGSGVFEPSSMYVGASSAPQPFLGRPNSPHSAEADVRAHTPRGQQQHPGGQYPHGGTPDHATPHIADGGGPEATAALLAAFVPTTSPHRHGGGFNMSSWGSPHHGGWAAGAGGGGGGGGGGRFSSISAGFTGGLVYRSMPISQVPGSAAEDGATGGGGGAGVRSSISPARMSGRAGKAAPTLGLMRDRHGSANATSAGPLATAAAAAVAAAGARAATSPHSMRPATSPSRARSLASMGPAAAGTLEPGYSRPYAPPSRQSPKRASHGTPPTPLVIGGVVMSPPGADGADGASAGQGGPGGEAGAGGAGGMPRGPMVPAMPHHVHAPAPIRHCGFGPRAAGHGSAAASLGSGSPPTLAMSGAAGPGSAGSATVAPSVFLGSRAKATDERIRSALLAKVLGSGAGGGGRDQSPPPQHHLLLLAHQQQQHQVAMQHSHGGLSHPQQHHGSPGGAAAEDAAAKGHPAALAANGMAPAGVAGTSGGPMHRQGSLPHLTTSVVGEHGAPPASGYTHPGHAGGFVPHAALPAGPTLAGRIGGALAPGHGHGHRAAGGPDHLHGASTRSYSFDSPRSGAVTHA